MTELKPCPFCGGKAETDVPPMRNEVTCTDCGAFALTVGAWNTRTDIANEAVVDLIAQNAELIKRVAELEHVLRVEGELLALHRIEHRAKIVGKRLLDAAYGEDGQ
jgi:hypothetical protein